MLYLAYLGESRSMEFKENSKKLLIVRKPQGKIPDGFIHVPQLSPSLKLFSKTQLWKKNQFSDKEKMFLEDKEVSWEDSDAWWTLYEGLFMEETKTRPDMVRAIERLKQCLKEGQDIYLFCYCKDVNRCHRTLIGSIIEEAGYEVGFRDKTSKSIENSQISLFDFDIF